MQLKVTAWAPPWQGIELAAHNFRLLRVYPHDGPNPSFPPRTAHHVTPRHGFVPSVPRPRTSRTENAKLFFAFGFARNNTTDLAEGDIIGLATSAAFSFSRMELHLQLKRNSAP